MQAMRTEVREALTKSIERQASAVVREMTAFLMATNPNVAKDVTIDWTWGDAPRGSISLGRVGESEYSQLVVTIYARAKSGSGFDAAWFEFGTNERVQKTTGRRTGRITPTPFFFPVYRANKQRVLSNMRSTLRRVIRKINGM